MSEAETILREVRNLREFVATIADRHIGRHELAERWDISPATLDRRVKAGSAPRPINGKWPLSVVVEWEMQQKRKAD